MTLRSDLKTLLFLIHLVLLVHAFHPPVQEVEVVLMHQVTAVEADQLPPPDVPGDKQTLPLVSIGVHFLHLCSAHLNFATLFPKHDSISLII